MKETPKDAPKSPAADAREQVEETLAGPDLLRDVKVEGFRLRTWDTNRVDSQGKSVVGYELTRPDGRVLFRAEDFACSPLHAIDSDECLRALLSFLTLRPGDTDADYFAAYTDDQRRFAETDAERLSLWAVDPPAGIERPPFSNWSEGEDEVAECRDTLEPDDVPRIYVACLAAYNDGHLHGRWIRCDQDKDDIVSNIKEMLAESPVPFAEEWAIHDYENWGGLSLHEFECLDDIAAAGEFLAESGAIAGALLEHLGGIDEVAAARRTLDEDYQGAFDDLGTWAEEFLTESGQLAALPENLRYYFDYAAFANDCELGGDIYTLEVDHRVHVFWNR